MTLRRFRLGRLLCHQVRQTGLACGGGDRGHAFLLLLGFFVSLSRLGFLFCLGLVAETPFKGFPFQALAWPVF